MSAVGAVTGNGVYAELEYKGKRFQLSQWTNDAMDAVSNAVFLRTARALSLLPGSAKQDADRQVALARSFGLGDFSFDAVIGDSNNASTLDDEVIAAFLQVLLSAHQRDVTLALAAEIVKNARPIVMEAISKANPQNGQASNQPEATAPSDPAEVSKEPGSLSAKPG